MQNPTRKAICACGKPTRFPYDRCAYCVQRAYDSLKRLPAYTKYVDRNRTLLSDLVNDARSYMGRTYRFH